MDLVLFWLCSANIVQLQNEDAREMQNGGFSLLVDFTNFWIPLG